MKPDLSINSLLKGVPAGIDSFAIGKVAYLNWNILRQDLPFPVAILKESALRHNSEWMKRFLRLSGAKFAPHGKTTMSPQLFERQLADGAWGITLSTMSQVQVARRFEIPRILLANQLLGEQSIRSAVLELAADPTFDFYCLVDSKEGVEQLKAGVQKYKCPRPLQVMVEIGVMGKRCGCRDTESALAVARAVKQSEPHLVLRGIEGFEGVISNTSPEVARIAVDQFLSDLVLAAERCAAENLFADGPILLSAGGSQYFDLVTRVLSETGLSERVQVIVRSGCYLTHDSLVCERLHQQLQDRCPEARELGPGLRPALEVWSLVQSRPEPMRVILTMGKRDCSFDADLPLPVLWYRPGLHSEPQRIQDHKTVMLHDQHAMVDVPSDSPLCVGDLVGCGISHPCTTFDRWEFIPIVDDDYRVRDAIRTFF